MILVSSDNFYIHTNAHPHMHILVPRHVVFLVDNRHHVSKVLSQDCARLVPGCRGRNASCIIPSRPCPAWMYRPVGYSLWRWARKRRLPGNGSRPNLQAGWSESSTSAFVTEVSMRYLACFVPSCLHVSAPVSPAWSLRGRGLGRAAGGAAPASGALRPGHGARGGGHGVGPPGADMLRGPGHLRVRWAGLVTGPCSAEDRTTPGLQKIWLHHAASWACTSAPMNSCELHPRNAPDPRALGERGPAFGGRSRLGLQARNVIV